MARALVSTGLEKAETANAWRSLNDFKSTMVGERVDSLVERRAMRASGDGMSVSLSTLLCFEECTEGTMLLDGFEGIPPPLTSELLEASVVVKESANTIISTNLIIIVIIPVGKREVRGENDGSMTTTAWWIGALSGIPGYFDVVEVVELSIGTHLVGISTIV
jgi:hypothetical protein